MVQAPPDFELHLLVSGPVELGVVVECVGLYGRGKVRGTTIRMSPWQAVVGAAASGEVEVVLTLDPLGWMPVHRALPFLYQLRKGLSYLHDTRLKGSWAEQIPCARKDVRSASTVDAKFPWILGAGASNGQLKQIRESTLGQIHQLLGENQSAERSAQDGKLRQLFPNVDFSVRPLSAWLKHPSGLAVIVEEDWHGFEGQHPPLTETEKGLLERTLARMSGVPLKLDMSDDEALALVTRKRPLSALLEDCALAHKPLLHEFLEQLEWLDAQSDFGRSPAQDFSSTSEVDHETMLAEGVSWAAIRRVEMMRRPSRPNRWFAVKVGPYQLWVENETQSVIRNDQPDTIYQHRAVADPLRPAPLR